MNYFVAQYLYAPDSEQIIEIRPAHRQWLGSLLDEGKLVGSGPFTDGLGGALIIIRLPKSATLTDAEELMDNDPFHKADALAGRSIREWNPVINVFADPEA
ncbi:YciI family protein [Corynebacterium alimapuense]|uniref:YCII-related domain-containing protein n=1 Tax=Corynebacterium alimapuense TaxID=1576874 RepID=A0A3M8K811_9CORY|nr:YciI family protein [Corynebacterium alimapuense]RNE49353.1 hypothetical protein C5L39_03025 [Corynebacterium alimapuense]